MRIREQSASVMVVDNKEQDRTMYIVFAVFAALTIFLFVASQVWMALLTASVFFAVIAAIPRVELTMDKVQKSCTVTYGRLLQPRGPQEIAFKDIKRMRLDSRASGAQEARSVVLNLYLIIETKGDGSISMMVSQSYPSPNVLDADSAIVKKAADFMGVPFARESEQSIETDVQNQRFG